MAKKTDWTDWYAQLEIFGLDYGVDVFSVDVDFWESEYNKGKEVQQAFFDKFPEYK